MLRELVEGVSYAKFAALAKRKEWTAEFLAECFRGKLEARDETLGRFFSRVLACDPSGDVVIPYRSVIEKYLVAVGELAGDGKIQLCRCGCGSYAGSGGRLAWDSCKPRPISEAQRLALEKANAARLGKPSSEETV